MPSNNKLFIHNTLIDVCFRAEVGLPLEASADMIEILKGIFAKAQRLYPVRIASLVIMPNHVHMLLVVIKPEDIPQFICYAKRESAHAINRLLGRTQRKVWQRGYDSPLIGSVEAALMRLLYHYTNPQKAGLVEVIEDYPNFNTWAFIKEREVRLETGTYYRSAIVKSGETSLEPLWTKDKSEEEKEESAPELIIEPQAWIDCFKLSSKGAKDELVEQLIVKVRERENTLKAARERPVMGAEALIAQGMRMDYVPSKRGRKTIIIDTVKARVKAFVGYLKEEQQVARRVRKLNDVSEWAKLPPGFFLTGGRAMSSLLLSATILAEQYA